MTIATLTAGTGAGVTVAATVPGTAVLNAWFDFNANGDWDDAGEQVFVDQVLTNGTNSLSAAIPAGATAGATFARFRVTSVVGYSYNGLAKDGEVEDYQVTIVAAKGSSSRGRPATSFDLWAGPFVAQPSSQQTTSVAPQRHLTEPIRRSVEPAGATHSINTALSDTTRQLRRPAELASVDPFKVVDRALEEVASSQHRPPTTRAGFASLDEQLVDQVFEEEMDLLPWANGSGGAI